MDEAPCDYSEYLSTASSRREFVNMQELYKLDTQFDADLSQSSANCSPSQSTSSSCGSMSSRPRAANGLVMSSPHQSGVALRWMPISEACLPGPARGRSVSESTSAEMCRALTITSPLETTPGHTGFELEIHDDSAAIVPGNMFSSGSHCAAPGGNTKHLVQSNDQAIEIISEESQKDRPKQGKHISNQPFRAWINTCEIRRVSAAKERRKLQNRRAQQAYRARQEQVLLKLQEQLASVSEQHASDVEEIGRLRALIFQLEEDNKSLRDLVDWSITMDSFDLMFTTSDKQCVE